jgi:hypothetical protein
MKIFKTARYKYFEKKAQEVVQEQANPALVSFYQTLDPKELDAIGYMFNGIQGDYGRANVQDFSPEGVEEIFGTFKRNMDREMAMPKGHPNNKPRLTPEKSEQFMSIINQEINKVKNNPEALLSLVKNNNPGNIEGLGAQNEYDFDKGRKLTDEENQANFNQWPEGNIGNEYNSWQTSGFDDAIRNIRQGMPMEEVVQQFEGELKSSGWQVDNNIIEHHINQIRSLSNNPRAVIQYLNDANPGRQDRKLNN